MKQKYRGIKGPGLRKLLSTDFNKTGGRPKRSAMRSYPLLSGTALVPVKSNEADENAEQSNFRIASGAPTNPARTASRWDRDIAGSSDMDFLTPSERAHFRDPFIR